MVTLLKYGANNKDQSHHLFTITLPKEAFDNLETMTEIKKKEKDEKI